jgi:hypothetical protein
MSHSSLRPLGAVVILLLATPLGCGVRAPAFLEERSVSVPRPTLEERSLSVPRTTLERTPAAPDPSPPAHRDGDGAPQGPGGAISDEPRDCGPSNNHCLRGSGWFTDALTEGEVATPRVPVFELDGRWYSWRGRPTGRARVFRTLPATAENLIGAGAKEIYVFAEPRSGKATFDSSKIYGALPASEREALTATRWLKVHPAEVDAASGTFVDELAKTYRISAARVAFDPREVE